MEMTRCLKCLLVVLDVVVVVVVVDVDVDVVAVQGACNQQLFSDNDGSA